MRKLSSLLVSTAALYVLSSSAPAFAYRASGESSQFPADSTVIWPEGEIRYEVSDEMPSGLLLSSATDALWQGFSQWNAVSCSNLRFVETGVTGSHALPGDGRNTVQWVEVGWEERVFASDAAAVSDVQYVGSGDTWRIGEVDLYLNAERFSWSAGGDDQRKSIRAVATHEGGHLLGLAHPCEPESGHEVPVCDASFDRVAMHPLYDADLYQLSDDDRAGVCALYPACTETSCGEGQACTEAGCRPLCGDITCGADEICVDNACISSCRYTGCSCAADTDCDGALSCIESQCAPGAAEPGDPCSSDRECASGTCRGAAGCGLPCGSSADCPGGDDECLNGICQQGRAAYGQECDSASACTSGLCMTGASNPAMCTRTCDPAAARPCPSDWNCEAVDGQSICVSPVPDMPSASCALAPLTPANPKSIALFALIGACAFIRRRTQV
ncbi:MAG: matrixin family metalloprotease [Polyangiaceae bacterium]